MIRTIAVCDGCARRSETHPLGETGNYAGQPDGWHWIAANDLRCLDCQQLDRAVEAMRIGYTDRLEDQANRARLAAALPILADALDGEQREASDVSMARPFPPSPSDRLREWAEQLGQRHD